MTVILDDIKSSSSKGGGRGGRQRSNGKAGPKKGPPNWPGDGERKTQLFKWTHNNNKKSQRHCPVMETKLLFRSWISHQLSSFSHALYSQVREMAPSTSERVQLTSNEPFSSFLRHGIKSITFFSNVVPVRPAFQISRVHGHWVNATWEEPKKLGCQGA